jgi:crossover junction endodeoxyribonuclease RuvC
MMLRVLLPKADPQSEDAADALAIAICHAHHRDATARTKKLLEAAR